MSKHGVLDELRKEGFEAKQLKQSIARSVVWSRDASHFQIQPQSTLRAKSIEDISKSLPPQMRLVPL